MSHFEHDEQVAATAGGGDLTITELVRLAIALDVPAADLLRVAVEAARDDDPGHRGSG
ncbi:hypothetical protein SFC88_02095 [Nocardioides sp. HM23]|uniref:hypothetical protein n=1 Tax=Nocardioides bizhenqiangii TaxID=3095076 RepID=UPI002ACA69CE|nr:hypothetical protein [Nocardioides sp. HM23]MDZ5619598.1 hypothetical protein [Nocardioides sp. HM23]